MTRASIARQFGLWGGALTLALTGALVHWPRWSWVAAYFLSINAVTFAFYGIDKSLSRRRSTPRIPERTLHTIAFLGGTPAAIVGQKIFRHKTQKGSFRLTFWLIALLQAGLVGLWLWYEGFLRTPR